ncbi:hypothetical protein WN944_001401 [Citrus x changshan-huyou]|uniref:Uncharacterized protein n=1 Tax=Citrus x changshan-huyou TaxID=2935761 RepID=A0AAP0QUR6_9ROSI
MAATPNKQFKNICVLSEFNYCIHNEFVEAAIDLGRSIAERKLHLVYRRGNRGLSKLGSKAAFVRGSQVLIRRSPSPPLDMAGVGVEKFSEHENDQALQNLHEQPRTLRASCILLEQGHHHA